MHGMNSFVNVGRVPGGIPTGGQFASQRRGEADVDLASPDIAPRDTGGLTDVELRDHAARSARFFARRYDLPDAEDLMQESLVAFLLARRNAQARRDADDAHQSFPLDDPMAQAAYLHTTTGRMATRVQRDGSKLHSSDITGLSRFSARSAEMENVVGRALTGTERDALAEQIRNEFPPGDRPTEGFHNRVRSFVGLEHAEMIPATTVFEPGTDSHERGHAPGGLADEVERLRDEGGRTNQAQAKRLAWDAYAETIGAPKVATSSFKPGVATKLRTTVSDLGGASELVSQWNSGQETPEGERVLFAPFGGPNRLSADEKHSIIEALGRNPQFTDRLWDTAVTAATVFRVR